MIKDSFNKQIIQPVILPKLKGHVKLTLRDAKTGKIEKVAEGDNIVTNAVRDIFSNNSLGALSYSKMMPLYSNWYGGVLLFSNAHALNNGNLDPDNYFQRDDTTSHLTAHAGDIAPASSTDRKSVV